MRKARIIGEIKLGNKKYSVGKRINPDSSATYIFQNKKGDTQMTVYHLFTGIKLTHHAVHSNSSYLGAVKKGNVIEIHHCREGRIERQIDDGYFYLTPGDLAIDIVKENEKEFTFPLNHYHGITISINLDLAPKCFSCFLKDLDIKPQKIAERLCKNKNCFILRSKEYIEHIFSEMYNVPCFNKKDYYKIKILELLLILNSIDSNENSLNIHTLSNTQVELAKRVAKYISKHINSHITISHLSSKFHISATHLQNAFKGVYGVTIFSYIRINKMNFAALELTKTNKSVMEIACNYGYDNASKFASAFREVMGETPLEYRKSHRIANTL